MLIFRIQQAEPEYKKAFQDELDGFKDRVIKRAKQKLEELIKEAEEEERQERLGPGGLDPIEVMESLPEVCLQFVYGRFCHVLMLDDTSLLQKSYSLITNLILQNQTQMRYEF